MPVLYWNFAILLGAVLIVELAFGQWLYGNGFPFYVIHDRILRYGCSGLYEGCGQIEYSRDRWGLRGKIDETRAIEILTVGGSTTNQAYLDDTRTWQSVLERELMRNAGRRVVVANAGVDGQSTFGHIHSLGNWLAKIPGLRPATVVFFVGINDIFDGYDVEFDALAETEPDWMATLKEKSAMVALARKVAGIYWSYRGGYPTFGHQRDSFDDLVPVADLEDEVSRYVRANRNQLDLYRRRLIRISAMARNIWNAEPVFMTQAAAFIRETPPARVSVRARKDAIALAAINRVTREVCATEGVGCADLARDVRFGPGDFYDQVHNTASGAEKIGRFLAGKLASARRRP